MLQLFSFTLQIIIIIIIRSEFEPFLCFTHVFNTFRYLLKFNSLDFLLIAHRAFSSSESSESILSSESISWELW